MNNFIWKLRKSAASFCHQVAARVPDMSLQWLTIKKCKFANNSKTAKAIDKISEDLESLEFPKKIVAGLTKF
jgi:hypothetical protein